MSTWPPAVLAALLVLIVAAPAHARHHGEPSVDHYVLSDGTGHLIANPGGHPVAWERCAPDGSPCAPHDDGDGRPQFLAVRDEPPGTAFTATQDGVTSRSEPWRGRVRATAPPRVEGEVRVGGLVRPLPATWEGGWGREVDWLQLQACRTPEGADCVVVLDPIKFGRCRPDGGRLLPARYAGRWLRVTAVRIDREQPFTAEGYFAPEGVRPNVPGLPGIAGAVVGQIAPGPPPAEDCGQPAGFPPGPSPEPRCSGAATSTPARPSAADPERAFPPPTPVLPPPAPRPPACVPPVRVSRVVLTRARLSVRVSRPAYLHVRLARRARRPHAARWRRVRSLTLRARAAGPATRRIRRLRPGRYRISIRSASSSPAVLERTMTRTVNVNR